MTDRVLCSKCGADEVLQYTTAETAVCPNCCEDHEYEYERGDRTHYCQHCGQEPSPDWYYCEDDVPLFGVRDPAEPIGIPASAMDGNAAVRSTTVEAREKWGRWVAFCESWGHP